MVFFGERFWKQTTKATTKTTTASTKVTPLMFLEPNSDGSDRYCTEHATRHIDML